MKGKMTKWFFALACSLALAGGLSMSATAAGGSVAINATNFPDANFRQFVIDNLNTDSNKAELSQAECNAVNFINATNLGIKSLKGVEYFPELTRLEVANNELTSLDVSKNTELVGLYCENNKLQSLDLSNNSKLEHLYCNGNQLASLNVNDLPKLDNVYCADNVYYIEEKRNELGNLVFDLSKLPGKFDLTKFDDPYKGSVSGTIVTFDRQSASFYYDYEYKEGCKVEFELRLKGDLIPIDKAHFPDSVFRSYITDQLDTQEPQGYLDVQEREECFNICIVNPDIKNLKGIEYFTALDGIYMDGATALESPNLSKNVYLRNLSIQYCNLKEIDVSALTRLDYLFLGNNQLTSLDVSKNTKLRSLTVTSNHLTELELSKNPLLETVYCSDNYLTSMDLSAQKKEIDYYGPNSYYIIYTKSNDSHVYSYDLKNLPGKFDASKITGISRAKIKDGCVVTEPGETWIEYQYDIGWGQTETFVLYFYLADDLAFLDNPTDQNGKVGDEVTFMAYACGAEVSYQWQYKNAGSTTWSNSGAAAAKTSTFTFKINSDASLDGRQYRCIATDYSGATATSAVAILHVETPVSITTQPKNVTTAVGTGATFSVTAKGDGLTYQWQYKSASSSTWSNSGIAAAKKASFTFTVTDKSLSGRQYRCVVTDKNGNKKESNAATLTVANDLAITTQPKSTTVTVGNKASFSVAATGDGLTYQWQYKNAGSSTWSNSGVTAAKNATFSFTVNDKSLSGRQYRCVVTDKYGDKKTSSAATLTVGEALTIQTQPTGVTTVVGKTATFKVVAIGDGVTYQWQYKNASSSTWSNSGVTAAKSATFTFTVNDKSLNGRQYRCVVTDKNGNKKTSSAATLTIGKTLTIKTQPISATVKVGNTAKFTVVADGDGLTYQWQYKNAGSSTWSNSGISSAKTATCSFTVSDKSLNGREYRCIVKDKYGVSKITSVVKLTVQ